MSSNKNEDSNHKNCTFKYFSNYIVFLTKYCTNTDKMFQEKLLFLNIKSIYYTNLDKKGEKSNHKLHTLNPRF